jgi:hypothetical protein
LVPARRKTSCVPGFIAGGRGDCAAHPNAGLHFAKDWDPFAFIEICERARHEAGTELERAACEIQRAEWQRLFDYCARRSSY